MYHTEFRSKQLQPDVFLARGAIVVGDVTLATESSVWFNAVLRGDLEPILIGPQSNIQDGAICHTDPGFPVKVGTGVTIGHGAIVHGANIGDNCIIGMGAIVLNGAVIGPNSIVGAGALVTQGKQFPAGSLILGSPARVMRALNDTEIAANREAAARYVARAKAFAHSEFAQGLG